jgi:hypothetical protein
MQGHILANAELIGTYQKGDRPSTASAGSGANGYNRSLC